MHPRLISRAFAGPVGRAGTFSPQPDRSLPGNEVPRRPSGPIYVSAGGLILVSAIVRRPEASGVEKPDQVESFERGVERENRKEGEDEAEV